MRVLSAIGFVCAHYSPFFVGAVALGLFLNWYGDSLDGTLARYREIERPHFGYLIDHSCDLISQTVIFLGLGLSPYFTLISAMFALSMYLLISFYTYIKVMILRAHQLSYGGMGATELRILLACWSLLATWTKFDPAGTMTTHHPVLDEVIGGMWSVVLVSFIWIVRSDLIKFRDRLDEQGGGRSNSS